MSEDLIKKSDAIGAITNHCENECYYRVDNWCPQCQREEFEEAIKAVPSADRPQGDYNRGYCDAVQGIADEMVKQGKYIADDRPQEWIPCSERLPDRYKRVLTTSKKGMVRENFINAGGWSYDTYSVVAWMPLPKPWKGTDDDG